MSLGTQLTMSAHKYLMRFWMRVQPSFFFLALLHHCHGHQLLLLDRSSNAQEHVYVSVHRDYDLYID